MSRELKPCPFCGSTDIEIVYNQNITRIRVQCKACEARSQGVGYKLKVEDSVVVKVFSKLEAIKQWNKRHDSDDIAVKIIENIKNFIEEEIDFIKKFENEHSEKGIIESYIKGRTDLISQLKEFIEGEQ